MQSLIPSHPKKVKPHIQNTTDFLAEIDETLEEVERFDNAVNSKEPQPENTSSS
jgi:hypothetical protein